jgi:hypothetical protein
MATEIGEDQDFRDALLADDLTRTPGEYVREQRARDENKITAAEILEGLRALDAGGDGVRWAIARVGDPDPAKNGHLATWATQQLDADQIRDAFGGGKYYVKGRQADGNYAGHKTVTIADDAPRRERVGITKLNGTLAPEGSTVISDFLSQQERRDRERQDREDKRAEKREQLILASLPAVATVFAAMFNRPQIDIAGLAAALKPAPPPPPTDPIQMIAALKTLAPEPANPGRDPMATAITLFELLADKAGNNGARADWLDVVKEGVKVLGPSVGGAIEQTILQARENGAAHGNSQNGAPQPAALSSPQQSPTLHIEQAASEAGMLDLLPHLTWLKGQMSKLAGAAARQRDPELYAAMFLEELPNGLTPQRVLELLSRSDWLQQLARFEPSINDTSAPWWGQLREALLGMIREALNPKVAPSQAGGEIQRPQGVPSLTGE